MDNITRYSCSFRDSHFQMLSTIYYYIQPILAMLNNWGSKKKYLDLKFGPTGSKSKTCRKRMTVHVHWENKKGKGKLLGKIFTLCEQQKDHAWSRGTAGSTNKQKKIGSKSPQFHGIMCPNTTSSCFETFKVMELFIYFDLVESSKV